jgi:hypothetical protein
MRTWLFAAAAALAAACTPAEEADVMSDGCDARAASQWAAGEASYSIEAVTSGPDCERAVATLTIRDSSGVPVYAEAYATRHLMTLAEPRDATAMQTALAEWVDPANNTTMATTSALPDWPANADAPANGEFPFYPESYIDREGYMALRQANTPLYCYVQGMESMACVTPRNDQVEKIGVQSFPG